MSHSFKLHEFVNLLMKNGVKFKHTTAENPYNRFEEDITCIKLDDISVNFTADNEFLYGARKNIARAYEPQDIIDYLGFWDDVEKSILISENGTVLTIEDGTPVSIIPDQMWGGIIPAYDDGRYNLGEVAYFTGIDGSTRVLVRELYGAERAVA